MKRKTLSKRAPRTRAVAPKPVIKKAPAKRSAPAARGMTFDEKADMIEEYARANDWWVKVTRSKEGIKLAAKKEMDHHKDTIACEWIGGTGSLLYVAEDGRTVRFRNLAAVKHHLDGSAPIKRPSAAVKRRAVVRTRTDPDGNVILRRGDDDYKPVGTHIIDHWWHVKARAARSKATATNHLAPINTGPFLIGPAEHLKEKLEAGGYTVELIEHSVDKEARCALCSASVAREERARPTTTRKKAAPKKRAAAKR